MNEGKVDRIIRAILGVVVLLIAFLALEGGAAQIVLWVIGAILLITAATGYCLLYLPFRFSTRK